MYASTRKPRGKIKNVPANQNFGRSSLLSDAPLAQARPISSWMRVSCKPPLQVRGCSLRSASVPVMGLLSLSEVQMRADKEKESQSERCRQGKGQAPLLYLVSVTGPCRLGCAGAPCGAAGHLSGSKLEVRSLPCPLSVHTSDSDVRSRKCGDAGRAHRLRS